MLYVVAAVVFTSLVLSRFALIIGELLRIEYNWFVETGMVAGQVLSGPGLPASNVLIFNLADGSKVIARPSGTEPKIKYYFMVVDRETIPISRETLEDDMRACTAKDKMLQEAWQVITS